MKKFPFVHAIMRQALFRLPTRRRIPASTWLLRHRLIGLSCHAYVILGCPTKIQAGIFKDMQYLRESAGSALYPKILGTYEKEISPSLLSSMARGVNNVIDIGAAEGYYAIGLARLMDRGQVIAYEVDRRARALLARVAFLNGVEKRVSVRSFCSHADLEHDLDGAGLSLIVCDCEGAEDELLRPDLVPALQQSEIVVELHEMNVPGISGRLRERFKASHVIYVLQQIPRTPADVFARRMIGDEATLSMMREFRPPDQCWYHMIPKSRCGKGEVLREQMEAR